jgi:hypothetical protein
MARTKNSKIQMERDIEQEFMDWLKQQTFNLCTYGWYIIDIDVKYNKQWYWVWDDILE